MNKDGSLQRTIAFRGPDLDSSTPHELLAARARANNVLRRLGSGWCVHAEAPRRVAPAYPAGTFPCPVATLVERERREAFDGEGQHFESSCYLTLTDLPPPAAAARLGDLLIERPRVAGGDRSPTAYRAHYDHFVAQTDGAASLRATSMPQVQPPGRWPGAHRPARVRQRPRTGSTRPTPATTPAGPTPPWRAAWDAEGRAVRVENRTVQDDACAALGPTAQRVGDYVQRANAAAGVTAAAQAGNETLATLVAQLQALQAQGLTDGRREVERLARDQAEGAYGQGQRRAVRSGWDDPAPPAGAVDEPFPLAGN